MTEAKLGLPNHNETMQLLPALEIAFENEPGFLEKRLINYPYAWGDWEHEIINVGPAREFLMFCESFGLKVSDAHDFSRATTYGSNPSTIQHILIESEEQLYLGTPFATNQSGIVVIQRGDIGDLKRFAFGPTPISADEAVEFTDRMRALKQKKDFYPDSLPNTEIELDQGVGFGEVMESYDHFIHYEHWSQKPNTIPEGEMHYMEPDFYKQLLLLMRRRELIGQHVILNPTIKHDKNTGGIEVSVMGEDVGGCPNAFFLYPEDQRNPKLLVARTIQND